MKKILLTTAIATALIAAPAGIALADDAAPAPAEKPAAVETQGAKFVVAITGADKAAAKFLTGGQEGVVLSGLSEGNKLDNVKLTFQVDGDEGSTTYNVTFTMADGAWTADQPGWTVTPNENSTELKFVSDAKNTNWAMEKTAGYVKLADVAKAPADKDKAPADKDKAPAAEEGKDKTPATEEGKAPATADKATQTDDKMKDSKGMKITGAKEIPHDGKDNRKSSEGMKITGAKQIPHDGDTTQGQKPLANTGAVASIVSLLAALSTVVGGAIVGMRRFNR